MPGRSASYSDEAVVLASWLYQGIFGLRNPGRRAAHLGSRRAGRPWHLPGTGLGTGRGAAVPIGSGRTEPGASQSQAEVAKVPGPRPETEECCQGSRIRTTGRKGRGYPKFRGTHHVGWAGRGRCCWRSVKARASRVGSAASCWLRRGPLAVNCRPLIRRLWCDEMTLVADRSLKKWQRSRSRAISGETAAGSPALAVRRASVPPGWLRLFWVGGERPT
jgi:hypothetical protein